MPTLTEQRQEQERVEAAERALRRAQPNKPPVAAPATGTGTFQQILPRTRNPNDPSLRGKVKGQKIQSFGKAAGGPPSKFSDQE
jgi:hypothetical protein